MSEETEKTYSEALLQEAITRVRTRKDSVTRFACMQLPAGIFHDLCVRLVDRSRTVKDTAEWLAGQTPDAPTRSSVERFSDVLFEEYRMSQLGQRRTLAIAYTNAVTAGDENAQVIAMKNRFVELLTDKLLDVDTLDSLDPKELEAITKAAKSMAAITFDKQKMDARIAALEKMNQHRQVTISLLEQKVEKIPERVAALEKKLVALRDSVKAGQEIQPAIYDAIFAELTALKTTAEDHRRDADATPPPEGRAA